MYVVASPGLVIAEQEALALLNFEYLAIYLCAYDLECNQSLSPYTSHSMQQHGMMEESSADRNQRLGCLRAQRHRAQQRRGSPRHSQVANFHT